MKCAANVLLGIVLIGVMSEPVVAVEVSSFCRAQVPGKYIIEAQEGNWNWGMAPIYDEKGTLHVFNSIIPKNGSWIKHSKIAHYTADKPEGPYTFVEDTFSSDYASYHNPQVSKVGDTYVLVFLLNRHQDENGSKQEVGIATARSLNGPWTESPHNPIIRAAGTMQGANIVHASNPSFVPAPDGTYRIYYKSMTDRYSRKQAIREISLAVSREIEGPYENYAQNPLISYMDHKIDIEDPYAFYYKGMYYMIVEDRQGVKNMLESNPIPADQIQRGGYRPGLIYTSKGGIDWGIPEVGYQTNEIYFGATLARSERPHILWKDGKPECLFLACHDDDPTAGYFVRIENWEVKVNLEAREAEIQRRQPQARKRTPRQSKYLETGGERKLEVLYKQAAEKDLHLDLYYPTVNRTATCPVIVFTHGGGWAAGSRTKAANGSFGQIFQQLIKKGFAVAPVSYRLAKKESNVAMRDCVIDCKDAIRYLAKNAEDLGIDPTRFYVMGDSAGGHIAQMLLLASPESLPGDPALADVSYNMVAGLSWYGPCDFEKMSLFNHDDRPDFRDRFAPRLLGSDSGPQDKLTRYREMSPINYLTEKSPPLLMIQGDKDTTIPVKHAYYMDEKAKSLKAPVEIMIIKNAGHNWRKVDADIEPSREVIIERTVQFFVDHF
ncbi:MAG TPA: alpha/beta hydrolase fold domain-containing protein [Sedimentisphaerales bacterium]|nr:alpha/beta hydrolase fold domain-containing protein [Sedimentisphaerales bacterium]